MQCCLWLESQFHLRADRYEHSPPGLHGGHHGDTGENVLFRGGYEEIHLSGKETLDVNAGDVLSIRTPGGGGWGTPIHEG